MGVVVHGRLTSKNMTLEMARSIEPRSTSRRSKYEMSHWQATVARLHVFAGLLAQCQEKSKKYI